MQLDCKVLKMDDKLVTLEKYEMLHEAEFTKDVLEENGIKAMVVGENLCHIAPYAAFANTAFVELQVFEGDLDSAKMILKTQKNTENGEG